MHLVLVGDSTLDNRPYTDGGPAVIDHVVKQLGEGSTASLLAVDGDMTRDVERQLETLPPSATHLVLSVGGNDALALSDVLARPAGNVSAALSELADVLDEFQESYRRCLSGVVALSLPTVVCTIYNGAFTDPSEQRVLSTTVRLFNDVIMQCALDAGCSVVDLRRIRTEVKNGRRKELKISRRRPDRRRLPIQPHRRPLRPRLLDDAGEQAEAPPQREQ